MQSCRFFLPTFLENFEVLKNSPYVFHKILRSHSTPEAAKSTAETQHSKEYATDGFAKSSFFEVCVSNHWEKLRSVGQLKTQNRAKVAKLNFSNE